MKIFYDLSLSHETWDSETQRTELPFDLSGETNKTIITSDLVTLRSAIARWSANVAKDDFY